MGLISSLVPDFLIEEGIRQIPYDLLISNLYKAKNNKTTLAAMLKIPLIQTSLVTSLTLEGIPPNVSNYLITIFKSDDFQTHSDNIIGFMIYMFENMKGKSDPEEINKAIKGPVINILKEILEYLKLKKEPLPNTNITELILTIEERIKNLGGEVSTLQISEGGSKKRRKRKSNKRKIKRTTRKSNKRTKRKSNKRNTKRKSRKSRK